MAGTRRGSQAIEIRVSSIDALFAEFHAEAISERPLSDAARLYLLDLWEGAHNPKPQALVIRAPAGERSHTDEHAVKEAVRADFLDHSGPYHKAAHFSHRERLAASIGIAILLISIAISTTLERLTGDVIVAGLAQGIVVIGWVALWVPAQRFAVDFVPHRFERRSYARLAQLEIRFEWEEREPSPLQSDRTSSTHLQAERRR
ncbi:MAG: hypothetical protein JO181_03600 [Solirubrobacterales bacterium]|nr:hypothetical protein [Solirubrobacterales bacterium]